MDIHGRFEASLREIKKPFKNECVLSRDEKVAEGSLSLLKIILFRNEPCKCIYDCVFEPSI